MERAGVAEEVVMVEADAARRQHQHPRQISRLHAAL